VKKLLVIAVFVSYQLHASDEKKLNIDPTKYKGGVMAFFLAQAAHDARMAFHDTDKAGAKFIQGAITELGKPENREAVKGIGADIAEGALKAGGAMISGAFVAGASAASAKVTATATGVKLAATAKGAAALKTAAGVGAAVVASPVIIPVAASVGLLGTAIWLWQPQEDYKRQREFSRCLRTNFHCTNVNDRGFSKRCDSPERRLAELSKAASLRTINSFTALKKQGKEPQGEFIDTNND
jgi:hypothetical protein